MHVEGGHKKHKRRRDRQVVQKEYQKGKPNKKGIRGGATGKILAQERKRPKRLAPDGSKGMYIHINIYIYT